MKSLFFVVFLAFFLFPELSWSLGGHPKTPREKAEEKINILKGVSLTSFVTRVSIPIPSIYRTPIFFTIINGNTQTDVEVELKKIGFEKMLLSGVNEPIILNDLEVWIATANVGKLTVNTTVRVWHPGFPRLKINVKIEIVPAIFPFNIHALETGTRLEIVPPQS